LFLLLIVDGVEIQMVKVINELVLQKYVTVNNTAICMALCKQYTGSGWPKK